MGATSPGVSGPLTPVAVSRPDRAASCTTPLKRERRCRKESARARQPRAQVSTGFQRGARKRPLLCEIRGHCSRSLSDSAQDVFHFSCVLSHSQRLHRPVNVVVFRCRFLLECLHLGFHVHRVLQIDHSCRRLLRWLGKPAAVRSRMYLLPTLVEPSASPQVFFTLTFRPGHEEGTIFAFVWWNDCLARHVVHVPRLVEANFLACEGADACALLPRHTLPLLL